MDPLFNKCFLPKPHSKGPYVHFIYPAGKTFITGLASSYNEEGFDQSFFEDTDFSELDYRQLMDRLNTSLYTYWPCTLCQIIGYIMCPFTLGLSFCLPGIAISQASTYLQEEIQFANET
jgi:hypothetical protein